MATVVSWGCQWRLTRALARNFGFNGWHFRQLYYKRTHGHSGGAQAPTMAALSWPSRLVVASILSSHFERVNASAHQTLNSQASSLRPSSSSHALTVAPTFRHLAIACSLFSCPKNTPRQCARVTPRHHIARYDSVDPDASWSPCQKTPSHPRIFIVFTR